MHMHVVYIEIDRSPQTLVWYVVVATFGLDMTGAGHLGNHWCFGYPKMKCGAPHN